MLNQSEVSQEALVKMLRAELQGFGKNLSPQAVDELVSLGMYMSELMGEIVEISPRSGKFAVGFDYLGNDAGYAYLVKFSDEDPEADGPDWLN